MNSSVEDQALLKSAHRIFSKLKTLLIFGLVLYGFYLCSLYSYLLYHSLVEIFSIIIGCSIFILVWNSKRHLDSNYLLFLGIGYLFISLLDLAHTLAYKGMGVFPGYDADLPTQLWIAARYLQSLSLLVAPVFLHRKFNAKRAFWVYLAVTIILLAAIFAGLFPECYVEGSGLTPFKIISEYIISAILLSAAALLFQNRRLFDVEVWRWLVFSLLLTIGAELAFTFYISVYGLSNLIGHIFKLIAFYFIYKAIVEMGLERPHRILFRNLEQSKLALEEALAKTQLLAITDSLTGLYNRHYFFELSERELERARRYKHDLSAIMLDIDQFKHINDTYGHAVGDLVLQEVAKCCRLSLRKVDIVGRYGGDEFVFMLPETNLDAACLTAKHLLQSIAGKTIITEGITIRISASLGIATLKEDFTTPEQLLNRADQMLYEAKNSGRNRVHCSP